MQFISAVFIKTPHSDQWICPRSPSSLWGATAGIPGQRWCDASCLLERRLPLQSTGQVEMTMEGRGVQLGWSSQESVQWNQISCC